MLKTVFFDLGNVLVFFNNEKMFAQIADCCGLTTKRVKEILIQEKLHADYETGRIDSTGVHRIFQECSPKSFTLEELLKAASDIFVPNTAVWPIVEQLKQANLRLILLSNISECHFNYVYSKYPVLRQFDDQILSFRVGVLKPDSRIFLEALSRAQCDPKECFYTDDIPEFINGAKQVGLDAELFTGAPSLRNALATRGQVLSKQTKTQIL